MSYLQPIAPSMDCDSERRINPRKNVDGLSLVDLGTENGGLILDLSEGGMALQAVLPIRTNAALAVHFELPNTQKFIDAKAEIAWGASSKRAGLRFTDISES